jgi:hypothetical protein
MFFTRWKDLGDRSESEVWTRHLPPRSYGPPFPPQAVGCDFQYGDICSAFGDSDDFKFDSLLTSGWSGNKAMLFRFRKYYLEK